MRAGHAHVLIAAASGRALAASARRGGYRPLVADFFGDQDTLALADAHVIVRRRARERHDDATVAPRASQRLAARTAARSASCAAPASRTGPSLLAAIAQRWTADRQRAGHGRADQESERVRRAVSHVAASRIPEIAFATPADPSGWLVKRCGGAGGQPRRARRGKAPAPPTALLPAARAGHAGVGHVPRRWPPCGRARLQHAVGFAHAGAAVSLWRRGRAGRHRAGDGETLSRGNPAPHGGGAAASA